MADERELFVQLMTDDWHDMFPGGYIGDGVYVNDLRRTFGEEYDAMTPKERKDAIRKMKQAARQVPEDWDDRFY